MSVANLSQEIASIIYQTRKESLSGFKKIVHAKYPSYILDENQRKIVEIWQLAQVLIPVNNSPDQTTARKVVSSVVLEYSKLSGYALEHVGGIVRELFEDFKESYSPQYPVSPTKWLMKKLGWNELIKDPFLVTGIEVSMNGPKKWVVKEYFEKYKITG